MNNQIKGSAYIAISAVFYATYGIWSKLMMGYFEEFNQAWTRGLMLILFLIPFGILAKKFRKIEKLDYKWFGVIGLMALNQAPYYYGFEHLSVGTATLLFYLMLVLGSYLLGKVFFDEKLNMVKYISLALAVIGLVIIYKFTLTGDQIIPAICVMIAGLMGAGGVVFSKKLSSNYVETQILAIQFSVMMFGNLLISLALGESMLVFSLSLPWLAQLGYAVAMLVANGFVIAGFKYLDPSIGGIIGLLEVVIAAVFGIVIFRESMSLSFVIGSVIILLAAGLGDMVRVVKGMRK